MLDTIYLKKYMNLSVSKMASHFVKISHERENVNE